MKAKVKRETLKAFSLKGIASTFHQKAV